MENEILTTAQAARVLGVSIGQMGKWLMLGDFPNAYRLNPLRSQSAWRIPKSDIDAFIAKRRAQRGWIRLPVAAEEEPAEVLV